MSFHVVPVMKYRLPYTNLLPRPRVDWLELEAVVSVSRDIGRFRVEISCFGIRVCLFLKE
jgi:hypothetical protein